MKVCEKIIKVVSPYCKEVRHTGGHYVCYLNDNKHIVTVSATPRGQYFARQIFNDFRRAGVEISEILKVS